MMALMLVALAVTGSGTLTLLHSYLQGQVDDKLKVAVNSVKQQQSFNQLLQQNPNIPTDYSLMLLRQDQEPVPFGGNKDSHPDIESLSPAEANRLDLAPPELTETVQGDADTQYCLGGFDLAEGEWLEVTMPAGLAGYWSLHAYNYWYEHLQVAGAHDRNTTPDDDGLVRIAIGPNVPKSAINHIDTLGQIRGALVCRIIGGAAAPTTAVHSAL